MMKALINTQIRLLLLVFLSMIILLGCDDQDLDKKQVSIPIISKEIVKQAPVSVPVPVLQDYSQTKFEVLDFAQRDYKGVSSLAIVLSVPLDTSIDIQSFFILERKEGKKVDGAWILSENAKELFFKNIEAEETYLLTIYDNLPAINQKTLAEVYKKSITTKAIEASASFAHHGGILPLSQSKGLPIYSVNTAHVDVEFHRVQADKLTEFLKEWPYYSRASNYRLQAYTELSDFVYSARFDLDIEKNKREKVILPINFIDKLSPSGIYIAVMKTAGQYDYKQAVTYFIRTDIGMHVRRYPGQLDVYLRSLKNADSLSDIQVSLLDEDNQVLTQAKSDSLGRLSFSTQLDKAYLLLAHTKNKQQMSLVKLSNPALDLSEFTIGTRTAYQNEAFIYAPRDIYRPGEKVDISMLLRNNDGRIIPDIPLKAVIKQEDGQIVERFTWQAQMLGYYYYNYALSDSAKTGRWSVEVELPGNDSPHRWFFLVEDFLPERLKLSLNPPETGVFISPEETFTIPVEGHYLYGATASGNRLKTSVNSYIKQEVIDSLSGYRFGLSEEAAADQNFYMQTAYLNNEGKIDLVIPAKWKKVQSPVTIKVTSSLFENGGRAVKRQTRVNLWPKKTMIAIRPHEKEPRENSLLKFDIISADQTGQLYPAKDLQVTLIKKRRDYYWSYNYSDEWQMNYSEKQYPVFKQSLSLPKQDKATIELPVEWGNYRLEIFNPATQLTNNIEFNAGGSWYYDNKQAQVARPDKVNLILDKPSYKKGDKAQLTIKAPFVGQGIVLVENTQGALWQQEVTLNNSNETTLTIPIQQDWSSHDIYISVILFNQPEHYKNSTEGLSIKRAIGLTHLPLDRSERKLEVRIDSVEKSKPFEPLTIDVSLVKPLKTLKTKAREVMLTLAAVDVGVLNVSNFKTPDPFQWFFAQREYTVDSLDLYGNIIEGRKGIMGKQRFGGDMDLSSAGNLQKNDSKIVSLFQQPVLFDADGKAQVIFDIPDFNGALRLMAVAFSEDSFGHAQKEVIIASPIVTQLSLPRFLATDDVSSATLEVHNLSEQAQTMTIELSSDTDLEIADPIRRILLEDQAKVTLHYEIKSHYKYGIADFKMHLYNEESAESIVIDRQWQLPIRPAWPAVQRKQQVILQTDQLSTLKIKTDDLISDTLVAELLVSNQPPINLASHLQELLNYPYGCLEQTTSSSFPWLYADQEKLSLLGIDNITIKDKPIDFSKRQQYLEQGVKRISAKQLSNGGFGLWSNQSSEEMWLSAYASHYLLKVSEQGIDVPQPVLIAALKRLQQYLHSNQGNYNYFQYSDSSKHLILAYKAYAAYVLSMVKQAPLGVMRTLFDYHIKDAQSGLPLMHLGIALARQGDLKRSQLAIDHALQIKRKPKQYLGDYGSTLRDISLMLEALIHFQPSHPEIASLLMQLQDELGKRQWLSTQERNALFMAGVALKENGQSQWQALVTMASKEIKIDQKGDFKKRLLQEDIAEGVQLISSEAQRLYAELSVNAYTQASPQPNFEHFNIVRTYYNTDGKAIIPEKIAVGKLMIVELSLKSKQRIQDALVIDLIPAGFEIENQNLEHSIKLDDYSIGNSRLSLLERMSRNEIKYQAWRDDRYIAAIDLEPSGFFNGRKLYYLLRAVTPGTYQVPPPYAEDMYRPYIRAIGLTPDVQTIINKAY